LLSMQVKSVVLNVTYMYKNMAIAEIGSSIVVNIVHINF
jgi:hypothetical protein